MRPSVDNCKCAPKSLMLKLHILVGEQNGVEWDVKTCDSWNSVLVLYQL